jgi:hypothetical protein
MALPRGRSHGSALSVALVSTGPQPNIVGTWVHYLADETATHHKCSIKHTRTPKPRLKPYPLRSHFVP